LGRENGTETGAQGATQDETTTTDHPGETGIYLMTGEVAVEDEATEATVMEDLEEDLGESARRAQHLHPRRRNRHQI
jgi:hypothetical protein